MRRPSSYFAVAAGRWAGMDQRGWIVVEPLPPFELQEGQQHCLTKQTDLVPQMDLEQVAHKQVAEKPCIVLHHINCSG